MVASSESTNPTLSSDAIGVVMVARGTVTATATDGSVRTLTPGDAVYPNEVITTAAASTVAIDFIDGSRFDLGRDSSAVLDSTVFSGEGIDMAQAGEILAAIQQILAEGGDPSTALPPTAAGPETGAGENEGHSAVTVDFEGQAVTPGTVFDTMGPSVAFEQPLVTTLIVPGAAVEDFYPTGGETEVVLDDEGLAGGITGGDNDVPGELFTFSGSLQDGGMDYGLDGAGSVDFSVMNGQTGLLGTETVAYNWSGNTLTATSAARGIIFTLEITDPSTGAYTVTLLQPVLHAPQTGTDFDDTENLPDPVALLNYTVHDANGDAAMGQFRLFVDDDMPVASDHTGGTYVEGSSGNVVAVDAAAALGIGAGADGLDGTLQEIAFTGGSGTLYIDGSGRLIYDAPAAVSNNSGPVEDVFSYTVTDQDGDSVTRQVTLRISDTGVTASATNELVDEDDLPVIGLGDSAPGDDTPVATGHISYTIGADGLGDIVLSTVGNTTPMMTLNDQAIDTIFVPNGQGGTLYGYISGTDYTLAANQVFTVNLANISDTGADYNTVLLQPVKHLYTDADSQNNGPETGYEDNWALTVDARVTDGDGTYDDTSFMVGIDDDMPVISDVYHGLLANAPGEYPITLNGTMDIAFGADGPLTASAIALLVGENDGGGRSFTSTPTGNTYDGEDLIRVDVFDTTTEPDTLMFSFYYTSGNDGGGNGVMNAYITDPTLTTESMFYTLTLNTDGQYTFVLQGLPDGLGTIEFTDRGQVPPGNFDVLYLPNGTGEDDYSVKITGIGLNQNTVNTSPHGLAAGNQNLNPTEQLFFEFGRPQTAVELTLDKWTQGKDDTAQLNWYAYSNQAAYAADLADNGVLDGSIPGLVASGYESFEGQTDPDQLLNISTGMQQFGFLVVENDPANTSAMNINDLTYNQSLVLDDVGLPFVVSATDMDGDTDTASFTIGLEGTVVETGYTLSGDGDNEVILGSGEDDVLVGGAGSDILTGQGGDDEYTGDDGDTSPDVFVYQISTSTDGSQIVNASGHDTINDYNGGEGGAGDVLRIADLMGNISSVDILDSSMTSVTGSLSGAGTVIEFHDGDPGNVLGSITLDLGGDTSIYSNLSELANTNLVDVDIA